MPQDAADPPELTGVGMVDDDGMLGGTGGEEPEQMPEEVHHEGAHHEGAQQMEVEESQPEPQQQEEVQEEVVQGEAAAAVAEAPVSMLSAERRAELQEKLADVEGRLAMAEKGLADQEGQRNRAPNPALKKRFESSISMFKTQVGQLVAERDAIKAELAT